MVTVYVYVRLPDRMSHKVQVKVDPKQTFVAGNNQLAGNKSERNELPFPQPSVETLKKLGRPALPRV